MCLMNKVTTGIAIVAVIFCLAPVPVSATTFDNLFVFGDSTVDTGWFKNKLPPIASPLYPYAVASAADGGRIPDTPYGLGAAQILAGHLGLTANPADNGAGGTNYAASGAQNNAIFINPNAPSTVSQLTSYTLAHGGSADPNALYLVSSGGNDIKYAQTLVGSVDRQGWVDGAATALANSIAALQAAGAHNIIVSNGYYAGTVAPLPTSLFARYYNDLFSDLSALNVSYILADVQSLETTIFANPGAYGFTSISNVNGPNGTALINPDPADISNSWALYGTTALLRSPNAAQTSFWADDEHFAAHAQQLEGDYLYSLVTPLPSTWIMLLSGFVGLGFFAYRGTKKNTAALAAA